MRIKAYATICQKCLGQRIIGCYRTYDQASTAKANHSRRSDCSPEIVELIGKLGRDKGTAEFSPHPELKEGDKE